MSLTNGQLSATAKTCAAAIARRRSAAAVAAAFSVGSQNIIAPSRGIAIPRDPGEFCDVIRDLPENKLTRLLRMPLQCFYALDEQLSIHHDTAPMGRRNL